MMKLRSFVVATALVVVVGPSVVTPQAPETATETAPPQPVTEETPAFPADVELVTVDVVVVDKEGRAVPGFERSDFLIEEDGDPQTIARFEAVELPPLPLPEEEEKEAPIARPRVSANEGTESRQHRTFALIFDDIHLSPAQSIRAKAAIGEFLRTGVRQGDVVSLVATSGSAWWNARMPEGRDELIGVLQRLDGRFTPEVAPDRVTDWEAVRIMAYDDQDVAYRVSRRFDAYGQVGRDREGDRTYRDSQDRNDRAGLIDPYVRIRAGDVYRQSVSRRRITMRRMARVLRSLSGVRGRKAMILVSQGFAWEQQFEPMRELVAESMRVNVPIHFIDTRGLQALPDFMTASFQNANLDVQDTVAVLSDITREAEGSENVALDTGGIVVRNTNDLQSGILRVSAESQAYYLIGYNPSNTTRDGKFRKIEVELRKDKGKGLKVRARRGYFAPDDDAAPAPETRADPRIVHALDSPFEIRDLPLRVSDFSFDRTVADNLNVILAVEIGVENVNLTETEGRIRGELAFLIEAQHMESGEYFTIDEKIEMAMLPETFERLLQTGYTESREFSLPPGSYQAKVVVRDLASGRIGSVIHDFVVPGDGGLRVTTPVLSDALEEQEPGAEGIPRPVLRVRRQFAPGSILYVQYSVHGAEKDEQSYLPQVMAGYEIRKADGTLFKKSEETIINPTSIGALLRLHGINMTGAEPGDYELVLKVRDRLANQDVEVVEPFSIATPTAAS